MTRARRTRWASLVMSAVTVAALQVAVLAGAAPPAAASADIQIYSSDSVRDSFASKNAFATCPLPNQVMLGGGGRLFFGEGGVALQLLFPHPDEKTYVVQATERQDGFSGSWYVRAYVVCGNRPAGYEWKQSGTTTLPNNARSKQAIVRCSAGKVVIGTGGVIGDVNRGVSFNAVFPTRDEVAVTGIEDPSDTFGIPNFAVGAYAVCANEPLGYEFASQFSQRASSRGIGVDAPCPAGKEVLGVGMDKGGDNGTAHTYSMYPYRNVPNPDRGVLDTRLWTSVERSWFVRSWAICAS